jgi:hypothetical protein
VLCSVPSCALVGATVTSWICSRKVRCVSALQRVSCVNNHARYACVVKTVLQLGALPGVVDVEDDGALAMVWYAREVRTVELLVHYGSSSNSDPTGIMSPT